MDLKCICLNCQNPPAQGAMDRSQLLNSNKRHEIYGNGNAFENQVLNIPEGSFEKHQNSFNNYWNQQKVYHPVYRTTSSEYGWIPPNEYTVPNRYYPRSYEFSSLLAQSGMYRNHSLNTAMDKSNV